eukprot:3962629-Pyramimonas_sp.AAC.1
MPSNFTGHWHHREIVHLELINAVLGDHLQEGRAAVRRGDDRPLSQHHRPSRKLLHTVALLVAAVVLGKDPHAAGLGASGGRPRGAAQTLPLHVPHRGRQGGWWRRRRST